MTQTQQYKSIFEKLNTESIISCEISGTQAKYNEPDSLFYTNFSSELMQSFYEIFQSFGDSHKRNPNTAPRILADKLRLLIKASDGICPLEPVMYASRIIRKHLGAYDVKDALISVITPYIPGNIKPLRYILGGWEWPQVLSIVIEACGNTDNDTAVSVAMDNYRKITSRCRAGSAEIVKSYIRMIEKTQNPDNFEYLLDITSSDAFLGNTELTDFLINYFRQRNSFFNRYKEQIAGEILRRTSNDTLRRKLERELSYLAVKNDANPFNFSGLSYEKQLEFTRSVDFASDPARLLKEYEQSRGHSEEITVMLCSKLLDAIDLLQVNNRQRALILIGTKCSRIKPQGFAERITSLAERYPELTVTSLIALGECASSEHTLATAARAMMTDPYFDSWKFPVGSYMRFKKDLFTADTLVSTASSMISAASPEELPGLLTRLLDLLKCFNGTGDRICAGGSGMHIAILDAAKIAIRRELSEDTCISLAALLEFMMRYDRRSVLLLLDILKDESIKEGFDGAVRKINDIFRRGDKASEPD